MRPEPESERELRPATLQIQSRRATLNYTKSPENRTDVPPVAGDGKREWSCE